MQEQGAEVLVENCELTTYHDDHVDLYKSIISKKLELYKRSKLKKGWIFYQYRLEKSYPNEVNIVLRNIDSII
jgi:hypothetical protein